MGEAFLINLIVGIIVSVAKMVVQALITPSGRTQQTKVRGYMVNTVDTQVYMPLVYGRHRVGVNFVDMSLAGTDNRYLHAICTLCEGEINGIVREFLPIEGITDYKIYLNEKHYSLYGDSFSYQFFSGTSTQTVCNYSIQKDTWDSALRYTAYMYCKFKYDTDVYQQRPEVTVEIEGVKVYNPATDITEYSNNPALCVYDFMTRPAYRGGMGIDPSRIDTDSIIAAAAYCDAKGWECNCVLNSDQSAIDHLKDLLSSFRGAVIYSGSKFRLLYQDLNYESVCMDLTESDIVTSEGKSTLVVTQPSIFDTPNAVKMKFYNSEKEYLADEYVLVDSDAVASDGDYREREINLPSTTSLHNVQKMANYFLERLRINKTAAMTVGSKGMALEPLDLVTVTHSRPGWSQKLFRVTHPAISQNGEVGLQLEEEDTIFYDDEYNIETHQWNDTNLPDPSAPVPSVINLTSTEETYYYRDRSFTRWVVDFDPPDAAEYPWFDYADIYIKVGETGDWKFMTKAQMDFVLDPVQEGIHYYCKVVSVNIWGAKQAWDYAPVISRLIAGASSYPSDVVGFTAMVHGDNVTLRANRLNEPDIAGYEVRMGSTWDGALFIAFNETPNFRLVGVKPSPSGQPHTFWIKARNNAGYYSVNTASTQAIVFAPVGYEVSDTWQWDFKSFEVSTITFAFTSGTSITASADCRNYGVAIGQYIWNSTNDTSSDAQKITDISSDGLTITLENAYAGTTGSGKKGSIIPGEFNNTEYIDHDGDALKCSHTSDVLTGTWLSPVYDFSSAQNLRLCGDFINDYESSDSDWSAMLPAATAWEDCLETGKKWFDVLQPSAGGSVQITLYWGATLPLDQQADGFELLSAEVYARYMQIKVTITDPNVGSNTYLRAITMTAATQK